jgi:thymidine kinase
LYIGPMWSGKTSRMCGRVERYQFAKKRCIVIKYADDTRYDHLSKSGGLMNHRGDEYSKVPIVIVKILAEVANRIDLSNIDVIGVDEGQFYTDAPDVIAEWARNGKTVIISALDTTYQGKPFGRVPELVSIADKVEKLSAVCMRCGADATFTERISGGSEIKSIASDTEYIAACRSCFVVYEAESLVCGGDE